MIQLTSGFKIDNGNIVFWWGWGFVNNDLLYPHCVNIPLLNILYITVQLYCKYPIFEHAYLHTGLQFYTVAL